MRVGLGPAEVVALPEGGGVLGEHSSPVLAHPVEGFTAVATHDEKLIEHAISFSRERGIPKERFQFQMLYGIRPQLQLELVRHGFDVLVATPYGPEWSRYLMRRLAERPANVLFLLRNLLRG